MINLKGYSFIFKKIDHADIIVCDNIDKKINFLPFKVYKLNKKKINLFYLFNLIKKILFNKKKISLKSAYLGSIIEATKAKVVIDNMESLTGLNLKKINPKLKFICYQNGTYWSQITNKINISLSILKPDYLLIWSKFYKSKIKKKIETIVTGSIRNNERIFDHKIKKKYDLMYISEFRLLDEILIKKQKMFENYTNHIKNNYALVNTTNAFSSLLLKELNYFSVKYKKKICIGMSSSRQDKVNKVSFESEKFYFKKFIPNCEIVKLDSETLAEKSNLKITMTSNLGIELISKGHKVLFLNINSVFFDMPFKQKNGPFWQKDFDKKLIEKKIKTLLEMSNQDYQKLVKKHFYLNYFDKNNLKLRSLLTNLIN